MNAPDDAWTPSEEQLRAWAELSEDYNPLHFDDTFCAANPFGRRIVFGALVLARAQSFVTGGLTSQGQCELAARFSAPVPVGEPLLILQDEKTLVIKSSDVVTVTAQLRNWPG